MDFANPAFAGHMESHKRRFRALRGEIQRLGHRGLTRVAFLREVSRLLFSSTGCETIEIRLSDDSMTYRWRCRSSHPDEYQYEVQLADDPAPTAWAADDGPTAAAITKLLTPDPGNGGLIVDGEEVVVLEGSNDQPPGNELIRIIAMLDVSDEARGALILGTRDRTLVEPDQRESLGQLARLLSASIGNRRSQFHLRERIKELTCLFGILRIVQGSSRSLAQTLEQVVSLLPPAWQFPEIAGARIRVDSTECMQGNRSEARHIQSAPIVANGRDAGLVEVFYTDERPEFVEGAFLEEEAGLIENVAREIAQHVERVEAAAAHRRLEEQLLHADRLATIGQLAAGVAHEINAPLANILGFAQLIQKEKGLPNQAWRDAQQIVDAALHGREVIQNLLLFARQTPTTMKRIDLNRIVRESADMLAKRCEEAGVMMSVDPAGVCTPLTADPARMKQMVINLMVNAIQAMPGGGTIRVRSVVDENHVELTVEDDGVGMSEEVRRRAFEPFFTTKDVHEGTGLGLSVVHGIVTLHGGEIRLESAPGQGARFVIRLPVGSPTATQTG